MSRGALVGLARLLTIGTSGQECLNWAGSGADGSKVGDDGWFDRLGARWDGRRNDGAATGPPQAVRLQTGGFREFDAPRAQVWTAYRDQEHGRESGRCEHIAGAPATGVGSKHIRLGPPLPPHGMRTVMYTEVIAEEEGHWRSMQTHAGTWQHEETWHFMDAPGGRSTVRISGWHVRPYGVRDANACVSALNGLARDALDQLTTYLKGEPGSSYRA